MCRLKHKLDNSKRQVENTIKGRIESLTQLETTVLLPRFNPAVVSVDRAWQVFDWGPGECSSVIVGARGYVGDE